MKEPKPAPRWVQWILWRLLWLFEFTLNILFNEWPQRHK
jgi:hypothetical protein